MGVCLLYLNARVLGVFPMFLWFDLVHGWFGDAWVVLVLIACGCVSVFLRFRLTVVDGYMFVFVSCGNDMRVVFV